MKTLYRAAILAVALGLLASMAAAVAYAAPAHIAAIDPAAPEMAFTA